MLASVLPKVFKLGSVVKNAYEWFSFAEEAVTRRKYKDRFLDFHVT